MTEQVITLSGRDYALLIAKATLRDQFAMAALTGLLASQNASRYSVEEAYRIADDMLAAREQKK